MKTKIFNLVVLLLLITSCSSTIKSEGVTDSVDQVSVERVALASNYMKYFSENTEKTHSIILKDAFISDNNDLMNPYDFIIRDLNYYIEYKKPTSAKFSEELIAGIMSVQCGMGNGQMLTYPITKDSDIKELSKEATKFLKDNGVKKLVVEVTGMNVVLFAKGMRMSEWLGL